MNKLETDGKPTAGDSAGEVTAANGAGEATAAKDSGRTYTDSDMAAARKAFEHKLRTARERASAEAVRTLLGDLGVESVDDLRERFESVGNAQTDAQKLQHKAKTLEAELAARTKELEGIKTERRNAAIRTAVDAAGIKAGCNDPELLYLLTRDRIGVDDTGKVFVTDEDGDQSSVSLEKLIKQVLSERPHLQSAAPATGGGSRPGEQRRPQNGTDLTDPQARFEAFQRAGGIYGRR